MGLIPSMISFIVLSDQLPRAMFAAQRPRRGRYFLPPRDPSDPATLPTLDFIALPRDELGRPIIPQMRVTALLEAQQAWESELGMLDAVTATSVAPASPRSPHIRPVSAVVIGSVTRLDGVGCDEYGAGRTPSYPT